MEFHIDSKSGKPVYLQLVDQVRYGAGTGMIKRDELLPSVRLLAGQLGLNRNTIAKAYLELERQGVIETIVGKGCFVRERRMLLSKQARYEQLSARLDEAIVTAHQLRIGPQALRDLLDERIRFFDGKKAVYQNSDEPPDRAERITDPGSTGPIVSEISEGWTPGTD